MFWHALFLCERHHFFFGFFLVQKESKDAIHMAHTHKTQPSHNTSTHLIWCLHISLSSSLPSEKLQKKPTLQSMGWVRKRFLTLTFYFYFFLPLPRAHVVFFLASGERERKVKQRKKNIKEDRNGDERARKRKFFLYSRIFSRKNTFS